MHIVIGSMIEIHEPTDEVRDWAYEKLVVDNPEYEKKKRMGLWTGSTPKRLYLYVNLPDLIKVPYGLLNEVVARFGNTCKISTVFKEPVCYEVEEPIPLYDYQEEAVQHAWLFYGGILKSKAGSGKTQMALELVRRIGRRTLWITHTKDLLKQSRERAKQFFPAESLGVISDGKVNIGEFMTFATIQTLCKQDLQALADVWDVIIVDECHRVSGSITNYTQYEKVLNALRARRKYGITATDHRADGMEIATHSLLGEVMYEVPDEAIADKVVPIRVSTMYTGYWPADDAFETDGTITHANLMSDMAIDEERNDDIISIVNVSLHYGHSVLVLSCRLSQLEILHEAIPDSVMIHGGMTSKAARREREEAIEQMRTGEKKVLLATYQLAKEGLDIPRLDVLVMGTPEKDEAVIIQSIGRIGRKFPGKEYGIVYDLVDYRVSSANYAYKKRQRIYKREGCIPIE